MFFTRYLVPATKNQPLRDTYRCRRPGCASSGYVYARGLHGGIDVPGDTPDIVQAGRGGVVVGTGDVWGPYLGNQVLIRYDKTKTGKRYWGHFSHLNKIKVRVGDRVEPGTDIGTVGSTGNTSGSHLHYELHTSPQWTEGLTNPFKKLERVRKA